MSWAHPRAPTSPSPVLTLTNLLAWSRRAVSPGARCNLPSPNPRRSPGLFSLLSFFPQCARMILSQA